jgi:formylglycine-generating enzyme required for sulfatase activity
MCLLAAACYLPPTESRSDEPDKAAKPAADPMLGKEPGQFRDDNNLEMKFIWCPPGEFTMGSPNSEVHRFQNEDQVEVTLTNGFWLGQTEVTQEQWKKVMETSPWKATRYARDDADYPASNLTGRDAVEFCQRLTRKERETRRLPPGWEYTLPTEAQWEYACRAGTTTTYSFGDDRSQLSDYAWFGGWAFMNTEQAYARRVGLKLPNRWKLYDMHGNLWEYCQDRDADRMVGGTDPIEQQSNSGHVIRGGSWISGYDRCRSARRYQEYAGAEVDNGFRVALISIQ